MRFYRFVLYKKYFETGYSNSHFLFKMLALFGIASQEVGITLSLGFLYAIFCMITGWLWYKFHFMEAENEVNNQFNPFVKEMRSDLRDKSRYRQKP